MTSIQCFLLERTDRARRSLRRYRSNLTENRCYGADNYHNAMVPMEEAGVTWRNGERVIRDADTEKPPKDDPRWPSACANCSYVFQDDDEWQVFSELLFVRPNTGEEYTLREAPPGAMWDASWFPEKGPDGLSLVIRLPNGAGDWHLDGLCRDGSGTWSRTGTPPLITARPSVLTTLYHGFLTEGFLVSC